MTIVERLRDIAEGKCTGLLAEEAEALLDVVEVAKFAEKNYWKSWRSDDIHLIFRNALSKLEAPVIPINLTQAEAHHLLAHLNHNEIDDKDGGREGDWYYGNKRNFIRRHKALKKKLVEIVEPMDEPDA